MASSTVTLGPITFTGREVPAKMPFGGKQAMSIHKQLGGKRVIDAMGPDPDPIKWSGLFFGPDASKRARLLDALKDTGAELRLAWGSFNFLVVIGSFNATYENEWLVPYQIECVISTVNPVAQLPGLEEIIKRDWISTLAVAGLPASIIGAVAAAQTVLATVAAGQVNGSLFNASMAALAPAVQAAIAAFSAIDAELRPTEAAINGVSLDAPVGNSVLEGFTAFQSEASNVAYASNLRIARAYVGRIVGNLSTLGG